MLIKEKPNRRTFFATFSKKVGDVSGETTNELDPFKGLTRLLTLGK